MRLRLPRLSRSRYVRDWSLVPTPRFAQAQRSEREYWKLQGALLLTLHAQYYYYAGYYEWVHGRLLNPFRVDPSRPQNFQLTVEAIAGRTILDVGCGPMTWTLSLVHGATVHAVDPLADFYREIQPFGWEFFKSVASTGAEQLPFDGATFDFVHCWNVLDHTRDADGVLREIARVLVPRGQLLLGCDVRRGRGGGLPHPYTWRLDAFEARIFEHFEPVTAVALLDGLGRPVSRGRRGMVRWVCRLEKKPEAR